MLSAEEARDRLEAMRRPTAPAMRGKPPLLTALGLTPSPSAIKQAAAALHELSADELRDVFEQAAPGLGAELVGMWEHGKALPYQMGFERRGFRAPNNPEHSLLARTQRLEWLAAHVAPFEHEGPAWIARWAGYLAHGGAFFAPFLASVIDAGGDEVFEILMASAEGEDEIGTMGRHVIGGLLGAEREDGWEYVERLLIAAQRQEGLRQVIFESVDEAHPVAFRRMLGLILEHDLVRFSSCARAMAVWLGLPPDGIDVKALRAGIGTAVRFIDDVEARREAIATGPPEDAFMADCAEAWADAEVAYDRIQSVDSEPGTVGRQFAHMYFMSQLRIPRAARVLGPGLEHADIRVAAVALRGLAAHNRVAKPVERLDALLVRLNGKPAELKPLVWPWTEGKLEPSEVAQELLRWIKPETVGFAIKHLDAMAPGQRVRVVKLLGPDHREALLKLLGDPSAIVREAAIKAAASLDLSRDEVAGVERLLSRKAGDLRRGLVALLLARGPEPARASAARLSADRDPQRRAAGEELRRRLGEQREPERVASLDDALGLAPLISRTAPRSPERHPGLELTSDAAVEILQSLDALVGEHAQEEAEVASFSPDGSEIATHMKALANMGPWRRFWGPDAAPLDLSLGDRSAPEVLRQTAATKLPLHDVWVEWAAARSGSGDPDGVELIRAALVPLAQPQPMAGFVPFTSDAAMDAIRAGQRLGLQHPTVVSGILRWLIALESGPGAAGFVLAAAEHLLASIPADALADRVSPAPYHRRTSFHNQGWLIGLSLARTHRHQRPDLWTSEQQALLWGLERWAEKPPVPGLADDAIRRVHPPLFEVASALRSGAATEADAVAMLLEKPPPKSPGVFMFAGGFHALRSVSGRSLPAQYGHAPELAAAIDQCRQRIVEVELGRGEAPTAAAAPAKNLGFSGGLPPLVALLVGLGSEHLVRGWSWQDSESRQAVYSHLIRATVPGPQDTPDAFAAAIAETKLGEQRLYELAAFAPQWARHVEVALAAPGLASAVWWFHAHTKDRKWTVDADLREAWAAEVSERMPLTGAELIDGACDVEWFHRVHQQIGEARWKALDKAAKYCSSAGGHTRAQLFAAAMAGRADVDELRLRISVKRHQDAVRAVGLLPLPAAASDRSATLVARYDLIQEFVRGARQFGAQRQASEKRAAEIGLANLARTAGYPDPLRLEWAMERRLVADLAQGPVSVSAGAVLASLSIDPSGGPELSVTRAGKALKSVPAAAAKDPAIKALRERATELRRQRSRMRVSLEQTMVRGDAFTGGELAELCQHPLLYPQLARLLMVGEDACGYPGADGRTLRDHAGAVAAVGERELVRVAHPLDLLGGGSWPAWQRDCIARSVQQPFKQIFRELYVLTARERSDRIFSARYGGHQLQPRAAIALLGGRGWVAHPEEGVRRTFHWAGMTATLWFLNGIMSPLEVEAPVLEQVRFSRAGEYEPLPLTEVPARIFSEVMRDLDLVVSVAHVGGVDPEASASTVEMRGALVRETMGLLGIENVRTDPTRALVDGKLGAYTVHLGSGTVHRQPGGAVCIVPIPSQHRGRIFLPFADDDPKTAEVVAKVLLLARDHEIKDPTILEQLQAV